jgi:Rrf2 family transcriptional regulator, cysteine metabolism repressor
MFKVSTRSRYGLRVMVYLARSKNEISCLREIAFKEKLSFVYLEKIVSRLKKAGLVKSQKGSQGGYFLALKPNQIKISQIIFALEDKKQLVDCVAQNKKEHCFLEKKCLAKVFWQRIQKSIENTLNSTTLADLIK